MCQVQAAKLGYLRRVHDVKLRDKVRSCEIGETLKVEPLLRMKRSQLRWFGHVTRMPQERLARQVLPAILKGMRTRSRPWIRWSDYISDLAWSCIGIEPEELLEIAVDREAIRALLGMLPPTLLRVKQLGK